MYLAQLPQAFTHCVAALCLVLMGCIIIEDLPAPVKRILNLDLKRFWGKKK